MSELLEYMPSIILKTFAMDLNLLANRRKAIQENKKSLHDLGYHVLDHVLFATLSLHEKSSNGSSVVKLSLGSRVLGDYSVLGPLPRRVGINWPITQYLVKLGQLGDYSVLGPLPRRVGINWPITQYLVKPRKAWNVSFFGKNLHSNVSVRFSGRNTGKVH
ncbi:hypothetical protein OSB04_001552 [Centaurea solstitialis]|uniref:Uncharacterized protein n=1 Tax=Centaurea solstitialis TaxID=347529 RepID=A0AA38U1S4_9ASTR|nr:hypothetical protein OSB04_001552 [Centaurea solstitialis]